MNSPWGLVPLSHVVCDLTNERLIQVEPDDDVTDPKITSRNHTISVATIQKGASVRITQRVRIVPGDLVFSRLHTQNGAFGFADRHYLATTTFLPLAVDESQIDRRFLFWTLHVRVPTLSSSDTVGRETYRPQDILSLQIPLPRLSEQRRIVAYLDGLQAKVDALKRLQAETAAELDAMLPSVLDKAFRGEL